MPSELMNFSILFVVVIVGVFLPLYSAQRTYYVTPTPDTPCPGEPCHTLSEYVEQADQYFTSDTAFMFLSGRHILEKVVTVQAVNNLTLCGNSSIPTLQSEVVCSSQPGGFSFDSVTDLYISTLTFAECGGSNNSAFSVLSASHCEIKDCTFENNTNSNPDFDNNYGGAVTVFYSNIIFSGNIFEHNSARSGSEVFVLASTVNFTENSFMNGSGPNGGVFVEDSIATFIGNTFMDHLSTYQGGGVALERSTASFTTNTFVHNSAEYGAGVYVQDSTATFTDNMFLNNTHNIAAGGGVYVSNSTVNLTENVFTNNWAVGASGGGVYVESGNTLYIRGNVFKNNSAINGPGGGLRIDSLRIAEITGNNFTDNKAVIGGGFYITADVVKFTANTFSNNCACTDLYIGGGLGGAGLISGSNVSFTENIFVNNTATADGGGIFAASCTIDLAFNEFVNNNAGVTGGAITFSSSTINFTEKHFMEKNSAQQAGGAIFASESSMTFYGISTLERNAAPYGGGIMLSESNVSFLESAYFENNEAMSGAAIYCLNGSAVTFHGNISFNNNHASYEGGSVYASRSKLHFHGTTTFANNSAFYGGGLLLTDESQCFFNPDSYVYFVGNSAIGNGGAIKADVGKPFIYCVNASSAPFSGFTFPRSECFFQISTTTLCNPSDIYNLNIGVHFENNTAGKGGNDVYGGQIDSCSLPNVNTSPWCALNSGYVFDIITENEPEHLDISSDPLFVCGCSSTKINCTNLPYSMQVYPGGTIQISVIALGQRNGSIATIIEVDAFQGVIRLPDLEYAQNIDDTCTDLNFTILSKAELAYEQILLYAQGPCSREGRSVMIDIEVLNCPHGFELSDTKESCDCETRLRRFTDTCTIDTATILRAKGLKFWVGYDNNTEGLILHSHCPFDYCTSEEIHIAVDEPQSDMQCNYNRAGKLCGACQETYSAVFGSSRCLQCSDNFLALMVVFAIAGIVLVLFVFSLRLTVSIGTINGLIFYANVIQVNSSIFFPSRTTNILTIFIAWLNLDLGIECCFYNGMDIYEKIWLQFVFPMYVWILAGIIILVCHFTSGRISQMFGRHPVAVLATLFLISYAKMLRNIIVAFSVTFLEYPDHLRIAVWLYDGNTRYLHSKHIALFTVSLLFLMFLFIPYTLLLFFGQWLQTIKCFSWINGYRVKPILDAHHAPYTNKHRYWTGLLLLIRCILFLIFAFNALGEPSVNLLAISSAVVGLIVVVALYAGVYSYNLRERTQHITRVYNNSYIGALEISFHFNLVILVAATYHINVAGGNQQAVTFFSVGIAFATFVGIVVYHATLQVRDSNLWKTITTSNQGRSQNASNGSNMIADSEGERAPILAHRITHSSIRLQKREPHTDT